ncbi:cobalt ECF transporter T component CbiQ [bacterium]|nr:cobalt ECF transporter T component CbiQ [bacterium]MBU1781790.1 cobalt ECF transporter T component CbiQ [bacterium]
MLKNNNFIERSIMGILSFLKESIFADEYAAKKGFLQSLDPRIKVITFILFLITILLIKSITLCLCLYAVCLVLAYFSNVHLGFFLKRTWIFIPIFAFFIAIPAIFSIWTPGKALLVVNMLGAKIIITQQGLFGAILFVTRVLSSVSFAILLSLTTKHFALLKVLRIFGIPQVFIMTLGMSYRYIYLFLEVVENTYLAIKSRVGTQLHYKKGQHIVAWNISSLWHRSYYLNEAVYSAMLSRGYTGEPVVADDFKTKKRDWVWLFLTVIFFIAILKLT